MNRIALALLVVCCAGAALAQPALRGRAQTEASAESGALPEEAAGEISGIVVSAKTGEPLRGVSVMYRGGGRRGGFRGGPRTNQVAHTGMDGRFLFAGLPAGEYSFYCSKTGYGMRNTFGVESRVRLGAGQTRDDVVIRLQPSAVVTGRVFDVYGEPLPGARVSLMSRSYLAGETRWRSMHGETTNDLGEYRLHGLGPGSYVVAVDSPREISPRGVAYREFAPVFHPGGDSPEQAAPVKLAWGEELTGLDFRLEPAPETSIRGLVTGGTTGEPCTECTIYLQSDSGLMNFGVNPTREGVFLLQGVPAGWSWIVARYRGPRPNQAAERVVVPDSGEIEVSLTVHEGQTVSAEVVLEDPPEPEESPPQQEPARRPRPQGFVVELEGRGPAMWGPRPRADASLQGGAVEFPNLPPGAFRVDVRAPGNGYLRAISLDGRILDEPEINVAPGVPLSGLKLHVAFDGATLEGVVDYPHGNETAMGAWILLIPDPGSSRYADRKVVGVREGQFRVSSVVPGKYELYAVPRQDAYDIDDPAVRRALEPFAKRITLQKGETAHVELSCIADPR